tara:strand:- start:44 stop:1273 length:1230 start_codon:yes stop_codon:yes gene_type:complete
MAIPSLAMIPSGYKANKVYSVLPTDGTGDFTTTRASTATRVNSSGLIETVLTGVPRLDYSDGTCPSLLLEPQSTNLITYSEDFSNAYWNKSGSSVVSDAAISPDGSLSAFKLVEDGANSRHRVGRGTFAAGTQRTFSVFAKKGERDYISLFDNNTASSQLNGVFFNLNTGLLSLNAADSYYLDPTIKSLQNGWYLCSVTWTPNSLSVPSVGSSADGLTNSYQGDGTSGVYIFGAQLEEGSYPTSYIESNIGTTTTRAADTAEATGLSTVIGQTEGVLYAELTVPSTESLGDYCTLEANDGTNQNLINFNIYGSGRVSASAFVGGVANVFINDNNYGLSSGTHKFAFSYKLNDYKFYIDGSLVGVDTSANVPLTDSVDLYITNGGSIRYKDARVYNTALTGSELAILTTI